MCHCQLFLQEDDTLISGSYVDDLTSTYRITSEIAGRLKSLFGFLAENVIQKVTRILNDFSKDEFSCFAQSSELTTGSSKGMNMFQLKVRGSIGYYIFSFSRLINLSNRNIHKLQQNWKTWLIY